MDCRNSRIGVATVRQWATSLPSGADVLDLGCGPGVPISQTLVEAGFQVYGIDASARMVAAFGQRFPHVPVERSPVEHSLFFGRTFDGVIAWGLLFLLPAATQELVIRKIARALKPGGRFLFTAPEQAATWSDLLTGRESISLGASAYRKLLSAEGLVLLGEENDEGNNHYYLGAGGSRAR